MARTFAEQVLDSLVDDRGYCGERGLSAKQYAVLAKHLTETDPVYCGGWTGSNGGGVRFSEWDAVGTIGRYEVELHVYSHFHNQYSVKRIQRWIDEVPTFENSDWAHEPKSRVNLELTYIRKAEWEQMSYSGYGCDTMRLYTFADPEGNCYIWKTSNLLEIEVEDEYGDFDFVVAKPGDKLSIRATVKENSEYKGIRQTVLTRCKVTDIQSR